MDSCEWNLESALNLFFAATIRSDPLADGISRNRMTANRSLDESASLPNIRDEIRLPDSVEANEGRIVKNSTMEDPASENRRLEPSLPSSCRLRSASALEASDDDARVDSRKQRRTSFRNPSCSSSGIQDQKLLDDRLLRLDQDEAYERSLAEDRAKEERRRMEIFRKR